MVSKLIFCQTNLCMTPENPTENSAGTRVWISRRIARKNCTYFVDAAFLLNHSSAWRKCG
jgi:hypothetical protein